MNTFYLQGITVEELENRITQIVKTCLIGAEPLEQKATLTKSNYLTRKETAEILNVSLVTLNKWSKDGLIKSYRISSRVRYKEAEIEEALSKVKSLKFSRYEKG